MKKEILYTILIILCTLEIIVFISAMSVSEGSIPFIVPMFLSVLVSLYFVYDILKNEK